MTMRSGKKPTSCLPLHRPANKHTIAFLSAWSREAMKETVCNCWGGHNTEQQPQKASNNGEQQKLEFNLQA